MKCSKTFLFVASVLFSSVIWGCESNAANTVKNVAGYSIVVNASTQDAIELPKKLEEIAWVRFMEKIKEGKTPFQAKAYALQEVVEFEFHLTKHLYDAVVNSWIYRDFESCM